MSRDWNPNWHKGAEPQVEGARRHDGDSLSKPECRDAESVIELDAWCGQSGARSGTEGIRTHIDEMTAGLAHFEFEEIR